MACLGVIDVSKQEKVYFDKKKEVNITHMDHWQ